MARKKSMDRALVAEVFKRLLAEIEKPASPVSPGSLPGVEADLKGIDSFINRLMTEVAPAGEGKSVELTVEYASGTKPVSLRIPNRVINAFRAEAIKTGASYQTLMIRALADAAEGFAL